MSKPPASSKPKSVAKAPPKKSSPKTGSAATVGKDKPARRSSAGGTAARTSSTSATKPSVPITASHVPGELGSVFPLCGYLWRVLFKGPVFFDSTSGPYVGMERLGVSDQGVPSEVQTPGSSPNHTTGKLIDRAALGLMGDDSALSDDILVKLLSPELTVNESGDQQALAGCGPDGTRYFSPSTHASGAVLIPFRAIESEARALKQCQGTAHVMEERHLEPTGPKVSSHTRKSSSADSHSRRNTEGKRSSQSAGSQEQQVMVASTSSLLRRGPQQRMPLDVPSPMAKVSAPGSGRRHLEVVDSGEGVTPTNHDIQRNLLDIEENHDEDAFGAWGKSGLIGGGASLMQSRQVALGGKNHQNSGGALTPPPSSNVGNLVYQQQLHPEEEDEGPRDGVCLGFRADPPQRLQSPKSSQEDQQSMPQHSQPPKSLMVDASTMTKDWGALMTEMKQTDKAETDFPLVSDEDAEVLDQKWSRHPPKRCTHEIKTSFDTAVYSQHPSNRRGRSAEYLKYLRERVSYTSFEEDHVVARSVGSSVVDAKEQLVARLSSSVASFKRNYEGFTKDVDAMQLLSHRYCDLEEEQDFLEKNSFKKDSETVLGWEGALLTGGLQGDGDDAPRHLQIFGLKDTVASRNSGYIQHLVQNTNNLVSCLQLRLAKLADDHSESRKSGTDEKRSSSVPTEEEELPYPFLTQVKTIVGPLLALLSSREIVVADDPFTTVPSSSVSSLQQQTDTEQQKKTHHPVLALLDEVAAVEEQVKRHQFSCEELAVQEERAGAEGEVDRCERLSFQRTEILDLAQKAVTKVIEKFPPVFSEAVDIPKRDLQRIVKETQNQLKEYLDKLTQEDIPRLEEQYTDLADSWKQSREKFYRENVKLSQDINECHERFTSGKRGAETAWKDLMRALTDLIGHRRQQQLAMEDTIALSEQKRTVILNQCEVDAQTRPLLEQITHRSKAAEEAARLLNQLITPLNSALADAAKVKVDSVPSLVFKEEKHLMHLQTSLFEAQMKLTELHQSLWRETCLKLGELEWKKNRALLSIEDRVNVAQMAVEMAGETLDAPTAKAKATERDELRKTADSLEVEVKKLSDQIRQQEEVFDRTSKPLLLDAGRISATWTPRVELLELNAKRDSKLGKIRQELLTAAAGDEAVEEMT